MEYYINVTANVTKKYIICAETQEEAIEKATEFFLDFITDENQDENCIKSLLIGIEEDDSSEK